MLTAGRDFTAEDVIQSKDDNRIRVRTIANGIVTGGISYELDPRLKEPQAERRGKHVPRPRRARARKAARRTRR